MSIAARNKRVVVGVVTGSRRVTRKEMEIHVPMRADYPTRTSNLTCLPFATTRAINNTWVNSWIQSKRKTSDEAEAGASAEPQSFAAEGHKRSVESVSSFTIRHPTVKVFWVRQREAWRYRMRSCSK